MTRLRLLAAGLLAGLAMSACRDSATPGPETTKLLAELPRVGNSPFAPCWMQREAAAQNSYVDTILDKTEKIYKAPCDADPKAGGVPKAAAPAPVKRQERVPEAVRRESDWHKSAPSDAKPGVDAARAGRTG